MLLQTFEVVLVGGPLDGKSWKVSGMGETLLIPNNQKNQTTRNLVKKTPLTYLEYKRGTEGRYYYVGKQKRKDL